MTVINRLCLWLGRLWGRRVLAGGVRYLRWRSLRLDLTVRGGRHLKAVGEGPFLVVANHIVPKTSPLAPMPDVKCLPQHHQSADSFLFQRAVRERTGRALNTVAKCDRGEWSPRPGARWVQRRLVRPFVRGQMEALPGYIAVENNPGSYHRRFLEAVAGATRRREPILILFGDLALEGDGAGTCPKAGAAHIARKFALPVLPACIVGSDDWHRHQPVTIAFGGAFAAAGMSKGEVTAEITRRVRELYAEYAAEHYRLLDPSDGGRD